MNALQDELIRKLQYVKRIAGEAEGLVKDAHLNGDSSELIETIQQQAETIDVLTKKLIFGKAGSNDPETDRKFRRVSELYRRKLQTEIMLEMEETEQDVVDEAVDKVQKR